ncbi:ATP-dependent DNA ligase [bacterium]|nr:ATP-dependent DNA ligase [bacterium]MDB4425797.1 ATP-dependent DNA ligase [bacterium]
MIEVVYRGGVYLPELDLWLDPHGKRERAFVSHAHFDHYASHEKMLCSAETAVIVEKRFRVAKKRIEGRPLREAWEERGFEIVLLPAGHITGSAMIHVTRLSDGATLLYTGDFKTRAGLTSEAAEFLEADIFITETTFGLPKYVFPPEDEIQNQIVHFVKSAFEDGEVPILLGYSLGKAQEAVAILEKYGISCLQHKTVAVMTEACREAGLRLKEPEIHEKEIPPNYALICPPNTVRSKALRGIKNKRTAMLTGWAMNGGAHYRYQTDAAIPLSDHADHPGLMEAIAKVNPKRVLTLHGSAREFAAELRSQGIEAWSVFGNDQMELDVLASEPAGEEKIHDRPECELRDFSELCSSVESSSGRLQKIRSIANYLKNLSPAELTLAATWLSGRAFGRGHEYRNLKVGPALIRQALLKSSGLPLARYRVISNSQNETARTARILLEEAEVTPDGRTLKEIDDFLESLAKAEGALERSDLLAESFASLHPKESESLVRILTGGLRIGSGEGLLEEAVGEAFSQNGAAVREAHMLLGDLGQVALLAREGEIEKAKLTPFVPIKVMLASPEETAEDLVARLGSSAMWLEHKYDGIRAQLHKKGTEVSLFSRDLRSLDGEFSEILDDVRSLPDDFILDGELIAYAEGRKLTFFDLQKRLGRTKAQGDLFLGAAIPVRFVAFDLLYHGDRDLLKTPLKKRRKVLEGIPLSSMMDLIEVEQADSPEEIMTAFKRAKVAGNEGLIVKDPTSLYSPGRRGKSWLKLKKAMPTLDCVVVKAQQGHGRRAEVLSDYTYAVRDEASGELRVIGKAYSGLTDVEIEELTEHFNEHTLGKVRRVHTVTPNIVLEIAFDSINKSKRHDSGLALRFPRIKAIRRDKIPAEIDTLQYAESLLGGPQAKKGTAQG